MGNARFLLSRLPAVAAFGLASWLVLGAFVWSSGVISDWWFRQTDPSEIFLYDSVEYVETDGDALAMVSTVRWWVDTDRTVWIDQLRCGAARAIFSTVTTEAGPRGPAELVAQPWTYTGRFPTDGRECSMRSFITVEVRGNLFSQTIDSGDFQP